MLAALTGSEPVLVILGAGLLVILLTPDPPCDRRSDSRHGSRVPGTDGALARTRRWPSQVCSLRAPLRPARRTVRGGVLVSLGLFFLKTGAPVFGSGLAIVPFLLEGVVEQHRLTP